MLKNFQTRSHSLGCFFYVVLFFTTSFTPVSLKAFLNETVNAFWIGLNDSRTEGEFRWLDSDDELQYENWMPGYPNRGDRGHCGQIRLLPQIQRRPAWVDIQCNADALPICERLMGALECPVSFYGPNCWQSCSPNCAGLFNFCDPKTGACLSGCKPGYVGDKCDTECSDNEYGTNCLLECSENCVGSYNVCDTQHGICRNGCREGYSGEKCDKECSENTYGQNCSLRCSQNCAGVTNICDQRNGSCNFGCKDGYSGEYCSIVVEKSRSSTMLPFYLTAILFCTLVLIVLLFIIGKHKCAMKKKTASRAALRAASREAPVTAAGAALRAASRAAPGTAAGAASGTASGAASGTASGAASGTASASASGAKSGAVSSAASRDVVSKTDLLPQTRTLNSRPGEKGFTHVNSVTETL